MGVGCGPSACENPHPLSAEKDALGVKGVIPAAALTSSVGRLVTPPPPCPPGPPRRPARRSLVRRLVRSLVPDLARGRRSALADRTVLSARWGPRDLPENPVRFCRPRWPTGATEAGREEQRPQKKVAGSGEKGGFWRTFDALLVQKMTYNKLPARRAVFEREKTTMRRIFLEGDDG